MKYNIYLVLISLLCIYGAFRFKRLKAPFQMLLVLCLGVLISEIVSLIVEHRLNTNSPVYHFFNPIHYVLLLLVYTRFFPSRGFHVFAWITALVLLSFVLTNIFLWQPLSVMPTYASMALSVLVISCSLIYYSRLLKYPDHQSLLKQPAFWFATGNFLFFGILFFLFAFFHFFLKTDDFPKFYFPTLQVSNLVLYLSYFIALLMDAGDIDKRN